MEAYTIGVTGTWENAYLRRFLSGTVPLDTDRRCNCMAHSVNAVHRVSSNQMHLEVHEGGDHW